MQACVLQDHTPTIITGFWHNFEPVGVQQFVEGLALKSLKDAVEDLSLWEQVKQLLQQVCFYFTFMPVSFCALGC